MEKRENSVVVNNEYKQLKVHSLRFDKTQLMINDEYELKQEGNAYYIIRRKPKYPKTYEECCKIVNANPYVRLTYAYGQTYSYDVDNLQHYENTRRLKICRDAYWKIAGEQMGLGKPWKPDFDNLSTNIEYIKIVKGCFTYSSRVFVFPTKEIRDAFQENFKELIEECKELL